MICLKLLTPAEDEALHAALVAVEKQIPKKPIGSDVILPKQFDCPRCGCYVGKHKTRRMINTVFGDILEDCKVEFNYCVDCGQRIEWGKENDG